MAKTIGSDLSLCSCGHTSKRLIEPSGLQPLATFTKKDVPWTCSGTQAPGTRRVVVMRNAAWMEVGIKRLIMWIVFQGPQSMDFRSQFVRVLLIQRIYIHTLSHLPERHFRWDFGSNLCTNYGRDWLPGSGRHSLDVEFIETASQENWHGLAPLCAEHLCTRPTNVADR